MGWFLGINVTRGPRGYCPLPEYNKYFHFKLDFLANQKPWLSHLWNQSKTKQEAQIPNIRHRSIICNLSMFFFGWNYNNKNKKPKLQRISYWNEHMLMMIGKKNPKTWWRILSTCLLSSFVEFCSAVVKKKSKMSQPIRSWLVILLFSISPKNKIW